MKIFICLTFMISFSAFSKSTVINFNQVLNEDVQKDIKRDEDKFKKEAARGPASVSTEETEPVIDETPKIDKTVRQIGPNKW